MNSNKSIPTNVDKMLWSKSRYIGYVIFTKYGNSIFCEVPSHTGVYPSMINHLRINLEHFRSFRPPVLSLIPTPLPNSESRSASCSPEKFPTPNKCYQLRDFGKKDFIQRYIENDFKYKSDYCEYGFYEYSQKELAKIHGPAERITADIKQITSTGAYVYVIKNVAYPSQFPVQWALNPFIDTALGADGVIHTTICGPGTGPYHCYTCNRFGSYRGVFLGYCAYCALHSYNYDRGYGYIDNGKEQEPKIYDWTYVMSSKYPGISFDHDTDEIDEYSNRFHKSTADSYLKGVDITTLGYTENIDDVCLPGGLPPTGPDICDNQEDMDPVREDEFDTNIPNQKTWVSKRYPRRAYGTPLLPYREVLRATQTATITPDIIREKMEILFTNNNISVSDNNYSFPIGPRDSWDHYRIEKRPTCWFGWIATIPARYADEEDVELCIQLYVSHIHTEESPAEMVLECNNIRGRSGTYWSLMSTMKAWILGETENPVIPHTVSLYMRATMDDYDSEEEIQNDAKIAPEEMENDNPLNNIFMASSLL